MSEHAHNPADKGAAIAGFFGGAVAILAISTLIVMLTNQHFGGKEAGEKPAAEAAT